MQTRRLPGFRFEVQQPLPQEVLPRMDIACFAGFASSGPLHKPVPVESVESFENIFGSDLFLAWDEARGERVTAHLAPSVRAFFHNGGHRAWVIRVAGDPQTDAFPLPGMLRADFDDSGEVTAVSPAYALARSPGSWADVFTISTSLLAQMVDLTPLSLNPLQFAVNLAAPDGLLVGDLLRLTFADGSVLLCAVKLLEPGPAASPSVPNRYTVIADKALWFKAAWAQAPITSSGEAHRFTYAGESAAIVASIPLLPESPLVMDWPAQENQTPLRLDLTDADTSPHPGEMLRVQFGGQTFWMRVDETRAAPGEISTSSASSPPGSAAVQVTGQGLWQITAPGSWPGEPDLVERLSFEIWARAGTNAALRLSDLTFDPRHPRCWDALPSDLALFSEPAAPLQSGTSQLWQQASNPRFPLAGESRPDALFLPIAIPILPGPGLRADAQNADPLIRDGLKDFTADLFLDPQLAGVGVRDLINEANTLRYLSSNPRALTGIHAALEIEEVTLIAVPDAVHRGWSYRSPLEAAGPLPSAPPPRPEWWHFLACDPKPSIPAVSEPAWGNFLNCGIRIIDPPVLHRTTPDETGTFTVYWDHPETGLVYRLEEAARPDFAGAAAVYSGSDRSFTFYGHAAGTYYYRVRAFDDDQSSDWSNGLVIVIAGHERWVQRSADRYNNDHLLVIQHAVLRMCAARGDIFAVLALPEHYREDDLIAHTQVLTSAPSGFFGPEEPRTLSFGGLYHPWLIGTAADGTGGPGSVSYQHTPPDGAVTGTFAKRTLARGAWIAPAGEPLRGVIALNPPIERGRWQEIQDARINLIRREPKGFIAMNADTLTDDPDLYLINVRRLLMLLRRLAFQRGADYVFEPNSDSFRRSVQRGFEALLDLMFLKGAFSGVTAAQSYRVVTGSTVNTPQSVDQGRFIVELRVAPSRPMRFLTIRLLQRGDYTLAVQES